MPILSMQRSCRFQDTKILETDINILSLVKIFPDSLINSTQKTEMRFLLLALSLFLQHPHDKKTLGFGVIGILCFIPDKALAGLVASRMVQIIFLFFSFLICKMGIISPC